MGGIETAGCMWKTNSKSKLFFYSETLLPLWECFPSHQISLYTVGNTDIITTFPSTLPSPTAS